jgi:hypothetical protein
MIAYRRDPSGEFVEIVVDGAVSRAEFDDVAARLEAEIARHGKVRVLEEVRSLGAMEPATFWADLRFSLRHTNDFSRAAVVTDKTWIAWLAKAVDPLVACEIRHFSPDRIEEARRWLREDLWTAGAEGG